ncbi:DUF421 domain-containing protein [Caulobacter sp. S45]|uniref:DUF421 domain-containing protein n=1 Tax=Caulobacter sp. S45 TaxID=1641861 RepID=UPI00131BC255|nr:YetF domain-containing protein [Caulobacter sp. S45]
MNLIRDLIGPDDGYQTAIQLSVRALFLFAFGVVCVRIAGRRMFSQAAPLDIIVYLIVGSNLSRIMIGGAHVFPSLAATLTIVMLHRLLAYATLRWGPLADWIKARPKVVIQNGDAKLDVLAEEGISEADLLESLRLRGIGAVGDVDLAMLERNGRISAIRKPQPPPLLRP